MHTIREVDLKSQVDEFPVFYLPHPFVIRESSLMTKVRPVVDASETGSNDISLNNCMNTGPNLIVDPINSGRPTILHSTFYLCCHKSSNFDKYVSWPLELVVTVGVFQENQNLHGLLADTVETEVESVVSRNLDDDEETDVTIDL